MSIPYVVDGETELSSELFNPWVDQMNGLETGALPIVPLEHMRAGVVNVLDIEGVVGDGVTDCLAPLQARYDAEPDGTCFVIPPGDYLLSGTLETRAHKQLVGYGKSSNLVGDEIAGPVILTYGGVGETLEDNQVLRDFRVSGTAESAIAFAHCPGAVAERISLDGFSGTDGFVFEYLWDCSFSHLSTAGATIQRACFKLNRAVIDSTFDLCYTTNFSDWSLYVDQRVQEHSTGSGSGYGMLHFDTFTAQGADVAALGLIALLGPVIFTNLYTENNLVSVALGNASNAGGVVDFLGCNLSGLRSGTTPYQAIIQNVSQINFFGGRLENEPVIIGDINANVNFFGCGVASNVELFSILRRTGDTPSSMPVFIQGDVATEYGRMVIKHTGYSWGFYEMAVDNTGAWVPTAKTPADMDWQPITSLTASGTTATAVCASHGYSTSDSVTIANASPKVFNGDFTITVSDADTFTYTLSGAAAESPAIGQPMVYKA